MDDVRLCWAAVAGLVMLGCLAVMQMIEEIRAWLKWWREEKWNDDERNHT